MKKTRANKLWSRHNLPAELLRVILSRLPAKSLLRFRCVAKSWRSLINDPSFWRSHLNNFENNRLETRLLVDQQGPNHRCVVRCNKTFKTTVRLDTLDASNGCTQTLPTERWYIPGVIMYVVISALDGLVLLMISSVKLILWNPSIRRARTIHVACSSPETYVDLGLGFDPITNDYTHIRFVCRDENSLHYVAVYTVGPGSWKTINFQDAEGLPWRWTFHDRYSWKSVCWRGIVYFTPRTIVSDALEMVSFDLSTEVFASTSLPIEDGCDPFLHDLTLVNGGCSLGWANISQTDGSIWVFESSAADTQSMRWTKRYTFTSRILCPSEWCLRDFLYIKKCGEMLVKWRKQVTLYDLETGEEKALIMNGRGLRINMVCGYIESLILLNG